LRELEHESHEPERSSSKQENSKQMSDSASTGECDSSSKVCAAGPRARRRFGTSANRCISGLPSEISSPLAHVVTDSNWAGTGCVSCARSSAVN
jgi:hypothetical protein